MPKGVPPLELLDQAPDLLALAAAYPASLRGALVHQRTTVAAAVAIFVASVFMVPLLGTEFVPKADYSETTLIDLTTPTPTTADTNRVFPLAISMLLPSFARFSCTFCEAPLPIVIALTCTAAGTLGGTLLSIIASIQSGDVTKTIVLATTGAVVSFVVSLALKWITRKWSRSR